MSLVSLDRPAVRAAFNRAARQYDRYAVLQHEVESRLLERLEFVRIQPRIILDLGCGTGSGSRSLQQSFPDAQIIALDWARAMLLAARGKNPGNGVVPLCADMHSLPLARSSVDLVFSSLAVQWSDELGLLMNELRRVLNPAGALIFSSFGPGTLEELRQAWLAADARPHVNRFTDMHDVGDALVRAGFTDPVMDLDLLTVEYDSVMDLMRELKHIGANNAASRRSRGLTGKQAFSRMLQAYNSYIQNDRYPASYEVIYGIAFGPPQGQPVRTPEGEWAAFEAGSLPVRRKEEGP